jgi:hypothetical protein
MARMHEREGESTIKGKYDMIICLLKVDLDALYDYIKIKFHRYNWSLTLDMTYDMIIYILDQLHQIVLSLFPYFKKSIKKKLDSSMNVSVSCKRPWEYK